MQVMELMGRKGNSMTRQLGEHTRGGEEHTHRGGGYRVWLAAILLPMMLMLLAACNPFSSGTGIGGNENTIALAKTPWCDKPLINFQDDSTTSQATITKWEQVHDQLGFTPYLPATLPKGSCLALAGGSIHDPIYGGHFSITYIVPQTGPISFSEAPKRANLGDTTQCSQDAPQGTPTAQQATPATAPSTVCIGAIAKTSITIAARQPTSDVQKIFSTLQADVPWVPANTDTLLATATPS